MDHCCKTQGLSVEVKQEHIDFDVWQRCNERKFAKLEILLRLCFTVHNKRDKGALVKS